MTDHPARASTGETASLLLGSFLVALLAVLPSLPGRMTIDALNMYWNALGGSFNDWHVPALSWLWWKIGASPGLIAAQTVLTVFALTGAFAVLSRRVGLTLPRALLLAALLAFLPPIYSSLTSVSKDSWVAALFVLMLVSATSRPYALGQPGRAVLLALAAMIRPEIMLLVPVFIWTEWFMFKRLLRPLLVYAGIVAGLLIAHNIFVYQFVRAERTHPEAVIFLFDLAGISVHTDRMLLPPDAFPSQDMEFLKKNFIPHDVEGILWTQPAEIRPRLVRGEALKQLRTAWFKAILAHPIAYLKVRLGVTLRYLHGSSFFHDRIDKNPDIAMFFPGLNRIANHYLLLSRDLFGSHALPFFSSLILLGFLWPRRENRYHRAWIAYLALAVLYQLEFMVLSVSPGFRYGYAGVVLFYLIAALALIQHWPDLRRLIGRAPPA